MHCTWPWSTSSNIAVSCWSARVCNFLRRRLCMVRNRPVHAWRRRGLFDLSSNTNSSNRGRSLSVSDIRRWFWAAEMMKWKILLKLKCWIKLTFLMKCGHHFMLCCLFLLVMLFSRVNFKDKQTFQIEFSELTFSTITKLWHGSWLPSLYTLNAYLLENYSTILEFIFLCVVGKSKFFFSAIFVRKQFLEMMI